MAQMYVIISYAATKSEGLQKLAEAHVDQTMIKKIVGYPRLRYVFDVADTGARRNSRPVNLWQMRQKYERPVQEALAAVFEVSARDPLDVQVENIANWLAIDYWMEHEYELADIVADSFRAEGTGTVRLSGA
ncbi:MAG: hypothetical protein LUG58_06265 [Clostridiales bacterium]|nr:hypothetical protein [Clostridiales bacterium]